MENFERRRTYEKKPDSESLGALVRRLRIEALAGHAKGSREDSEARE